MKRSLTLIDKTKPPSPIYVRQPIPTFRSEYEKQKYYEENKKRCLEGYGELPGTLYDYLQNHFIKHRITPVGHDPIEPPIARIASLWIHQAFHKTRSENKFQGIIKARGIGLSSEFGAMANHFAKYYPGSTSLMTSKDQAGISVLFREKIYQPYLEMHKDLRADEISRNDTTQRCDLRVGVSHIGVTGKQLYSISQISLRETSEKPKSPNNFSGQGAKYGFIDEFPLHPKKDELLNSAVECFRDPFTKELTGTLAWGGTCEDTMTNESITALQKMVANKKIWDCNILFVPYWWGMFLTNGHPNQKKAEEWWDREYAKVEEDTAKARAFIRNNPRTLEDIFETVKGGRWEDETLEKIAIQKKEILKADVPLTVCNLVDMGGTIHVDVTPKGSVVILEHPKPGIEYALCVDGIKTGTETGAEDGSSFGGVMVKIFDPESPPFMPVCLYKERPRTVEMGHMKLVNQVLYYNKYGRFKTISAEANDTADSFVTYLKKKDLLKYCLKRVDLSGKGYSNTNKIFNFRGAETIRFQYELANIFLRKFITSIQMMPLIDEMLTGKDENADLLDAWLQFFIAFPNFDEPPPTPRLMPKRTITTITFDANGRTVYKDVPI